MKMLPHPAQNSRPYPAWNPHLSKMNAKTKVFPETGAPFTEIKVLKETRSSIKTREMMPMKKTFTVLQRNRARHLRSTSGADEMKLLIKRNEMSRMTKDPGEGGRRKRKRNRRGPNEKRGRKKRRKKGRRRKWTSLRRLTILKTRYLTF